MKKIENVYKGLRCDEDACEFEVYFRARDAAGIEKALGVDQVRPVAVIDLATDPDSAVFYKVVISVSFYSYHDNVVVRYYFANDKEAIRHSVENEWAKKWNAVPENIHIIKLEVHALDEWRNVEQKIQELTDREARLKSELEQVQTELQRLRKMEFGLSIPGTEGAKRWKA